MIKLKKIFLVSFILLFSDLVFCSEQENNWYIKQYDDNNQVFLIFKNESSDELKFSCLDNKYLIGIETSFYSKKDVMTKYIFSYQLDRYEPVLFEGINFAGTWMMARDDRISTSSPISVINKYKTLFQQMLNTKESLTVNAEDVDGEQYTVSFNIKGLPEALMEFAERCGPEFQEFSGIRIKNIEGN